LSVPADSYALPNALPCQRCGGDDSVAVVVWVGSPDSERDAAERPRQCGRHTRMGRLSRQPSGAGTGRGAAETGTPAWCRPTRRGGVCRVRLAAWVLLMWAVAQPSAMSQPWRECVDIDMYGASPPRPGRIAAGRPLASVHYAIRLITVRGLRTEQCIFGDGFFFTGIQFTETVSNTPCLTGAPFFRSPFRVFGSGLPAC